ncbi:hypothetical protein BH10CHL1_BH10CHL1_40040 [soil metagenome]
MKFKRLKSFTPDLFACLLLVGLPLLVFWQTWSSNSPDRVMFGGDILMGAYPTRVFVHRLFELGATPLWNPYQLGGMPLLGDVQVAPYYLPNLLLDLFYQGRDLTYIGFEMLVIAHYALGALFLYAYLRGLGVRTAAALIGAIGFEFNGFFVGHRGHYNMLAVVVWLPGVLWLLDQAWHATLPRRRVAWAVLAGLALSQMVMAGHPQVTFYCALTVTGYFAYRWVLALRHAPGAHWRERLWAPALFALAGVIAAGIAAVALLPVAELLGRSLRDNLTYDFTTQYSLLPRDFVGLLVPEFLGWSGTEFRIYAGILTLFLAVVAFLVPARPERNFFGVAMIIALITALGGFTVLHGLVYRFVPGFSSIRVSTRAFYIANLSLSILAAFGAEKLLGVLHESDLRRLRYLVRGAGALLVVAVLLGAVLYTFLLRDYQPVGDSFFMADSLFSRRPSAQPFTLLTQTTNAYLLFVLLLAASTMLLWARIYGQFTGRNLAIAAMVLMFLDVATFAPYHDTIKADPATSHFTIKNYATSLITETWQIGDQQQLIAQLHQLPDGVRVDNAAEVLPDNYSAVYQTPFATGYNILDLQERFALLKQWPKLSNSTRRDLMNVGYVLTAPDVTDPPEPDAHLVLENSQGKLWARAQQPSYAHFSTNIRPAAMSIAINGLLNQPGQLLAQPAVDMEHKQLHETLRQFWPAALEPALYLIGKTGVRSPVDISVLAGGPIKYSAIIVDGVTVTPQQRGIVLALIDPKSGQVLAADGFDTYQTEAQSNRLAAAISAAADGTIVALATYDEGTAKLNAATRLAFASLGATIDLRNKIGAAYALIGVKGSVAGAAVERLDTQSLVLDVGIGAMPAQPTAQFTSRLLTYQPDRISLLVQNDARGLLTISESVYPGWAAYIDGRPTPILRTNGLLRAVILPPALAGQPHEVTFVYQPLSARLGSAISMLMLTVVCALLLAIGVLAAAQRWPAPLPKPKLQPQAI